MKIPPAVVLLLALAGAAVYVTAGLAASAAALAAGLVIGRRIGADVAAER